MIPSMCVPTHEMTSQRIATIASRGLNHPVFLSQNEIREVCGSALTQVRNRLTSPNAIVGLLGFAMDEHTSARIGSIAARGLTDPASLTLEEIKEVCGSALSQ